MKTIEMVPPREISGSDTISRFDMQFQAAAYAALEILKGNGVDCVYCEQFVKIGSHFLPSVKMSIHALQQEIEIEL